MTIEVSDNIRRDLEDASAAEGVPVDEMAAQLLRKALAMRKLEGWRRKLRPQAEAAGFRTDEDFFNAFS